MNPTYAEVELLACQIHGQDLAVSLLSMGAVYIKRYDELDPLERNAYRKRAREVLREASYVDVPLARKGDD